MLRLTVSHCQENVHTEYSGNARLREVLVQKAVRGLNGPSLDAPGLSLRFRKSLVRLFVHDPVSEFQSVAQPRAVALETQL